MANRVLEVLLTAKDGASAVLSKVEGSVKGFSLNVGSMAKMASAALAGVAIGKFFKDSITEGAEAEKGLVRLGAAVTNAGGNFKALQPALMGAVDGVRQLTTYSGGELTEALTRMTTITGDVAGSTENLGLAADLAAARNIELSQAADIVGKAMNGNVTALNKLGIAGKDSQTAMDNLRAAVGGFAEKEAQTFDGQLKKLNNGWKDFQEEIGGALIGTGQAGGAMSQLNGILAKMAGWVADNREQIGKFVDVLFKLGGVVVDVLVGAFKLLEPVLKLVVEGLGSVLEALGWLVEKGGALLKHIGIDIDSGLGTSLKEAGKALKSFTQETVKAEKDQTAVVAVEAPKRTKLRQDQLDQQAKDQKEHTKLMADATEALAVKQIMLDEGVTEAQAKELLKRRQSLGESLGVTVTSLKDAYAKIDKANLLLAASFNTDLTPKVKQTAVEFKNLTATGVIPTETALDRFGAVVENAGGDMADLQDATKKGGIAWNDYADYAISAANGLGLLKDSAASAANHVLNLVEGVAKMFSGDPKSVIEGLSGVISGAIGILGKLFGEDPKEAARVELVKANSDALRNLSGKITDILGIKQSGADIEKVLKLGQSVFSQEAGKKGRLAQGLAGSGLSIDDIEELGKVFGISVVSKEGRFEFDAFRQLMTALNSAQIGTPQTFAGLLDAAEKGKSIGALDEAGFQQSFVKALAAGGSNSILGSLQGIDFADQGGQDAAVERLRALFLDITGTPRTAAELAPMLGGLTSSEFLDSIEQLIALIGGDTDLTGLSTAIGGLGSVPVMEPEVDIGNGIADLTAVGDQQVGLLESIDMRLAAIATNTGNPPQPVVVLRERAAASTATQGVNEALYEDLYDAQLSQGIIERG